MAKNVEAIAHDSDSQRSPAKGHHAGEKTFDLDYDPDAGKSDEERAAIVSNDPSIPSYLQKAVRSRRPRVAPSMHRLMGRRRIDIKLIPWVCWLLLLSISVFLLLSIGVFLLLSIGVSLLFSIGVYPLLSISVFRADNPQLSLLYLVSFLDRTNIGNAKIAGLMTDLNLTGGQYATALSVFFVSYSLFEPLTNVLLKRFRPTVFLTATMIAWGIVMTLMGIVHDWRGLTAARFFLGVAEAGLFPGVNFLISSWYKRSEIGIRCAVFFSAAAIAGSFGGLLASGIAQMNGIAGLGGWRWIFILEGIMTVLIGIACWWLVHDFPDQATFLSEDDRIRVLRRLRADNPASSEAQAYDKRHMFAAFKDWKTYAYSIIYMGADGALYSFSLFLPSIIAELGYSSTRANLLSVPPYVGGALLTIFIGWYADRTNQRGWCNMVIPLFGMVGFSMLLGSSQNGVKYAGTFLGAMGIYPCIANTIVWAANNTEGSYKRGVTLGLVIGWGNLNGIMSSNIYLERDKPNYRIGHGIVLGYLTLFLWIGSIVTHFMLVRENKLRRTGKRDYLIEGKTEEEILFMGDKRPDMLYTE